MKIHTLFVTLLSLGMASLSCAQQAPTDPQKLLENHFRLGQSFDLEGQKLLVEKIVGGKLVLAPPAPRTASIGAFITPVTATASSSQEGRTPSKMIDGSGWGENFPGSGVYVHTNNVYDGGTNMWNAAGNEPQGWMQFDLGQTFNTSGFYIWNYNEGGGYANRSARDISISSSLDGQTFSPVGDFTLDQAPGTDDYKGQIVSFKAPVKARYFKFDIRSNYRGNDVSGMAEIRFADADHKEALPVAWKATYPRPTYPVLAQGEALKGAENIVYPADMGIVDLSKAPYNAKGDGKTDDTDAIQRALDEHPGQGAILYLPNGRYLVSRQLRFGSVGGDGKTIRTTTIQGQSRGGTIIQLADGAPRFDNPRFATGVIWTGQAPAQRFGNEIRNLTIDTGTGNPGACGLQFMANNQGGVYDVTIVSGDGQGVIGLDMAYTDEEGPLLVKNVRVQGFDVGVATATSLASETMEHVSLESQNVVGFRNAGQAVSVRDLRSHNRVPAVVNSGGLVTLIGCNFTGTEGAETAVVNEASMLARDVQTTGYKVALSDRASGKQVVGNVSEFRVPAPKLLGYTAATTIGMLIKETPSVPWDDPKTWASPLKFGAQLDDGQDDSEAIQKAIDSGATTVYLPRGGYNIGHTIVIRGNVRRIVGGKAYFVVADPLKGQNAPMFRFEDGAAPVVVLEGISTDFSDGAFYFLGNNSKRTLVMQALLINFQGPPAYKTEAGGTGDAFIEDVVGQSFWFKKQNVWGRQFNPELNFHPGTHVQNDGGHLWALGFKTEGGGTQIETLNGGVTEILGGLIGDTNAGKMAPMFVNRDSQMSITVVEVSFNNDPYDKFVSEMRGGQTSAWNTTEGLSGMRPVVYDGHEDKP